MSLLLNEEFSIYQLRAGYLHNIKDGIGDRLITLNTAVFNSPAFRAAGWVPDPADVRRPYSPPIPTAVASDYFQLPARITASQPTIQDAEEDGGLVTGHNGSNDTLGPSVNTTTTRRKKRKQLLDEDDSSDLSDESDDDDDIKTAVQSIKFNKMPLRHRSGSSPVRPSKLNNQVKDDNFSVTVTSPSRQQTPSDPPQRLRRGSSGAIDAIKQRARRDTATSSEWSSENETEAWLFRRQKVQSRTPQPLPQIIHEEDHKATESDLEDENISEASDLSDEYHADLDLGIDLDRFPSTDHLSGRPPATPTDISQIPALNLQPKQQHQIPPVAPSLPRLPSVGRPVSYVQPVSLLSKVFKSHGQSGESPFQQFAQLSGKGDPRPLWVKIYAPFSDHAATPLQVPIRRTGLDGAIVAVVELIGLSFWQYEQDQDRTPKLAAEDRSVNRWTLRMVDEDEQVDFDFPALGRARPVTDFSSNNNRADERKGRLRARETPWDEFALVRATDEQYEDNKKATPQYETSTGASTTSSAAVSVQVDSNAAVTSHHMHPVRSLSHNPMMPSYAPDRNLSIAMSTMRNHSTVPLLGAPLFTETSTAQRSSVAKTITIHYIDPQTLQASALPIDTPSDTYIAEIFSVACTRLRIDKSMHVLKVRGTQTVVPQDRTVEALGEHSRLDMTRRRFVGIGDEGSSTGHGSPRSESPNAPLILPGSGSPAKTRRKGAFGGILTGASRTTGALNGGLVDSSSLLLQTLGSGGKRYNVIRKQPLSFAPSHPRTLALEGEYVHVMPAATFDGLGGVSALSGGGKTTSVHLSSVVGCKVSRKHPKMIRMLVYREKETKRYDFEANTKEEAAEIMGEVRRGIEKYGVIDDGP